MKEENVERGSEAEPTPVPRSPADIQAELSAPFDPAEIKWKPQAVKGNRALAIAYIDARHVQQRLDDVVGVDGWMDDYQVLNDGSVVCRLSMNIAGRHVTKTDVGSLSEQPDDGDKLKAAFSDALKRAAVKFGVGRYLYRLAGSWLDYDPVKKEFTQAPQLPAWAKPAGSATAPPATTQRQQQTRKDAGPVPTKDEVKAAIADAGAKWVDVLEYLNMTHGGKYDARNADQVGFGKLSDVHKRAVMKWLKTPKLPQNGEELFRRLRALDAKLAGEKVAGVGALLAYVSRMGAQEAHYPEDLSKWSGADAMKYAAELAKKFQDDHKRLTPGDVIARGNNVIGQHGFEEWLSNNGIPAVAALANCTQDDLKAVLAKIEAEAASIARDGGAV